MRQIEVACRPRTLVGIVAFVLCTVVLIQPHRAAAGPSLKPAASSTPSPSSTVVPATTPTRDSVRTTTSSGHGSEWLIALGSALVGAALTLTGERLIHARQEKKALALMLGIVDAEVDRIAATTRERMTRSATDDAFPFYDPLPVSAWANLRSSGIAWRLVEDAERFTRLDRVYTEADSVNGKNLVAVQMFGFSQTENFPSDVAARYLSKAMSLTIEPYADLHAVLTLKATHPGRSQEGAT